MPIYEYKCDQCNYQFEILQKISDAPPEKCPACNASNPRKLVSAAAFKLKGTGWYETDFKTKKSEKDATVSKKNNDKKSSNVKADSPQKKSKSNTNKDVKIKNTPAEKPNS